MSYSHDTVLVVASIVVSMVAAFTGLALTNNISHLPVNRRKALVVMSSFVLGTGIWSMHFVAMLAHKFPFPVYYDVLQTLSSALVAILVVGVSLLLLHFTVRTRFILALAGSIFGVGILSMHYIGMTGIRGAQPLFSNFSTALSVVVAVVMGVAAVLAAYGRRSKQNIVASSLLMGFSVVIVHFTAMHGTQFTRSVGFQPESAVLATSTLAVIVTLTAFIICGSFLLAATTFLTSAAPADQDTQTDEASGLFLQPGESVAANDGSDDLESPRSGDPEMDPETGPEQAGADQQVVEIPFERDKKISLTQSDAVAAIRADGHYSHLYTRDGILFCPWSIAEAEKRLAASGFHRTHRSYLVNVSAIASFEKRRETGICMFENYPKLSSVPVSRNRVFGLLNVLESTAS